MASVTDRIPDGLTKLGTYAWPRSAARQTLGHLLDKIKDGFVTEPAQNAVADDKLLSVSYDMLRGTVDETLTAILIDMLDQHYLAWARSAVTPAQHRAFVHPPMKTNLLRKWADHHKFPVLDHAGAFSQMTDAPCIVIPHLETLFARDYGQMTPLFDLFKDLATYNGNVLVGCNSWAWRFLKQFDDIHLLFADAYTFPAFDADALAAIFDHAQSKTVDEKTFVSVRSGKTVLTRDDDGDLSDPYLRTLAGASLGHPWVAVDMFFRSIAETKDTDDDTPHDDKTWVDIPDGCSLPTTGSNPLLFALHTLMIHGSRPVAELNTLLPHRVPNGTWSELERHGFVKLIDGVVHCNIRNYPDTRSELGAAGFNLDAL